MQTPWIYQKQSLQQAFKFCCCPFTEELKTTPQTNLDVEPHDYHIN